ncbi:hypothetical protein GCM10009096_25600 [Parasphingorhabdus litoris]|uniref:Cell wall hydrolase SleB domain-containing protein n=1 Tax=Parasphingorhabdus litoris TaxID=394733 RepID=A0ABN1AR49_9SPHN|nr:cell wall hydrolase [Parasphingorhabdus litoris]
MNLSEADKNPRKREKYALTWRGRFRTWILFVVLFCLIPLTGLLLSGTSLFERDEISAKNSVSVDLGPPNGNAVSQLPGLPTTVPDISDELNLELSAEDAVKLNNAVPDSKEKIIPARPFVVPATVSSQLSRNTAINCLTSAIYYEAASEAERGQRAVAQVVLNRVRHPAYPNNICGVVFQGSERSTGCQFTFTCDGSLARTPVPSIWNRAQKYAAEAIAGTVEESVGTATHYHTVWIVPYWAKSLDKVKTVGSHIFYRWSGYWGKRQAFSQRYAGEDLADINGTEGVIDDVMDFADNEPSSEETPDLIPEIDPILTPKFEAGPSTIAPPNETIIAADGNDSSLAADENRGTLILE